MFSNKKWHKLFSVLAMLAAMFSMSCLFPSMVMSLIPTSPAPTPTIRFIDDDTRLKEIMREKGVILTARQVQYDMTNNVGNEFGLTGEAELCDYYNWGYDVLIKSNYFCVKVVPSGGYLEKWYIYFRRDSGSKLYQVLLERDVQIFLIARINPLWYDEDQENMATGSYAAWY